MLYKLIQSVRKGLQIKKYSNNLQGLTHEPRRNCELKIIQEKLKCST